jgi:PAS domain S-box-containing protein
MFMLKGTPDQLPDSMLLCERFIEQRLSAGCWTWDAKNGEVAWTDGIFELLGLEPQSITASIETYHSFIHPDDRTALVDLRHSLREGMKVDRQFRVVLRNGATRWHHSYVEPLMDRNGALERAFGIIHDITAEHERAVAFERNAQRLTAAMAACTTVVFTAAPDGNISDIPVPDIYASVDYTRYFGQGWHKLVHPDDLAKALARHDESRKTRQPYDNVCRVLDPEGNYRWRRTRWVPIPNANGSIKEYMGMSFEMGAPADAAESEDGLTSAQIRAARAIVNWSVKDLADAADISVAIIRRLEETGDPEAKAGPAIAELRRALEIAGVVFFTRPGERPAVRPR